MAEIIFAVLGGVLPALIWLWFWLKEDLHPEPKKAIALAFFFGMLAVPVAFVLEKALAGLELFFNPQIASISIFAIFGWAFIEEYLKYFAARHSAFKKPWFDEPIDALIYILTAALGFAALENILFIFQAGDQGMLSGFVAGNMRFIGATLLHILASSAVGVGLAFGFFKKEKIRRNVVWGLLAAVGLHALFNFFIIKNSEVGVLKIFSFLWLGVIILL
ncbi:MAG: PrsW family glutamic-type intramembrane protease, partial [Patescibacteria group bacterium]